MPRRFQLSIDPTIYELAPSYAGVVLYVEGVCNAPSDAFSDALLEDARSKLASLRQRPEEHPHMRAWADVYRAFGAKPKRYRNGCLALARRTPAPRVNALVDVYNAIAMKYMIPVGGEDWDQLQSDLIRTRARGSEPFLGNEPDSVLEHASEGEPIWLDAGGVTTRRFNWRQARRTRITLETRAAYFVLDAVAPYSRAHAQQAASELYGLLRERWPKLGGAFAAL